YVGAPRIGRMTARAPGPSALGAGALALALGAINHGVLPRLYPAFHLTLTALTAMTAPLIGRGWRGRRASDDPAWLAPLVVSAALVGCIADAPRLARGLSRADNLRMIFLDHAPLLGLGVELGARLAPPAPLEPALAPQMQTEGRLQVDWRGHDILLVTV